MWQTLNTVTLPRISKTLLSVTKLLILSRKQQSQNRIRQKFFLFLMNFPIKLSLSYNRRSEMIEIKKLWLKANQLYRMLKWLSTLHLILWLSSYQKQTLWQKCASKCIWHCQKKLWRASRYVNHLISSYRKTSFNQNNDDDDDDEIVVTKTVRPNFHII